jgi:glycosyltransferase involved in cell wall biosynthesis
MPKTQTKKTTKTTKTVKTAKAKAAKTSAVMTKKTASKKAPKVSVIIPFYNVEDYIEDCLKSVLTQTLKDIEVILINDASTDGTRSIAQKYADKDKRIKILDVKTRNGQGYARNRGIEIAKGEYIGFVDSDDFVEKDMFQILYNKAVQTDSDITMCQVREYDDMNGEYISSDYYALACLGTFEDNVFSAEDTKDCLLDINVALWNKIYKREYLLGTGEKFPEGFIYEDLPFFFGTYLPAKRLSIVWKSLYNYRINRKNSTMQQFNNKILDRPPMVSLTFEKIKKVPYFEEIKQKVQGWMIDDLFHRYVLMKEPYHKEFFFLMKRVFENLQIENPEDNYWKCLYHFQGYNYVMNNTFEDFNQIIFNNYVDVHEMEKLFESKTILAAELHARFDRVYEDFKKTYDYTDDKVKERAGWITAETDEKINKVYEDISKNYEYTNQKDEEIKSLIHPIYEDISKNYDYTNQKDEEIKAIIQETFEEISKNYDYTNEKNEELKAEIQKQLDEGFSAEKLTEFHEEIKAEIKQNIEYVANVFKETTNKKLENASEKITRKSFEYANEQYDKLKFEMVRNLSDAAQKLREHAKSKAAEVKDELKSDIATTVSATSQTLTKSTNDKISELYDEISKSYNYTNEKGDELKLEVMKSLDKMSSELTDNTNSRLTSLYDDISKNYDFTKEQNQEIKDEFTQKLEEERNNSIDREKQIYEHASKIAKDAWGHADDIFKEAQNEIETSSKEIYDAIDNNFSRLYDEIFAQKNYAEEDMDKKIALVYDQINEQNEYFNNVNNGFKNELNTALDNMLSDSNYRQELIFNEINKNLQYTNDLSNNIKNDLYSHIDNKSAGLYGDIKDLSYVVQNNYDDLIKKQSDLKETTEKLFGQLQTGNEEQISAVRGDLNNKFNEVSGIINNTQGQINEMIDNIKNIIEQEKQNNNTIIKQMKSEFMSILDAQQKHHNNEVTELREQIKKLESDLREEMKSPVTKLLEKYQRKSEKQ